MPLDNQEGRVSRMKAARSISFKIDVCNHLTRANNNVAATAKHFKLLSKQFRYYGSRHEIYIVMSNKVLKKNLVQLSASRNRKSILYKNFLIPFFKGLLFHDRLL